MKFYKVVERVGDNTVMSVGRMPRDLKVTYCLNGYNKAPIKNSKIFVFSKLDSAYSLFNRTVGTEIWEVSVKNPKEICEAVSVWHYSFYSGEEYKGVASAIYKFWNGTSPFVSVWSISGNSYSCSEIKFVKRIE